MTRLAMSALFGHLGHVALAAQSQIPLRTGDCVVATQTIDFFYKDEGEYERTHRVYSGQPGTLLNLGNGADDPSTVEWIQYHGTASLIRNREPVVEGAVFMNQFARSPWEQGVVATIPPGLPAPPADLATTKCMTAVTGKDVTGYQPVIKMSKCGSTDKEKWAQQFTYSQHICGPRPIRSTADPSKCVDAVHPNKVLLTDCSGVDSQKFQFRCGNQGGFGGCYILAMGGRKDMCLWFDTDADQADLQIRSCNFDAKSSDGQTPNTANGATNRFFQALMDLHKQETRPITAPVGGSNA